MAFLDEKVAVLVPLTKEPMTFDEIRIRASTVVMNTDWLKSVLKDLVEEGLVREPRRLFGKKKYSITDRGRKAAEEMLQEQNEKNRRSR